MGTAKRGGRVSFRGTQTKHNTPSRAPGRPSAGGISCATTMTRLGSMLPVVLAVALLGTSAICAEEQDGVSMQAETDELLLMQARVRALRQLRASSADLGEDNGTNTTAVNYSDPAYVTAQVEKMIPNVMQIDQLDANSTNASDGTTADANATNSTSPVMKALQGGLKAGFAADLPTVTSPVEEEELGEVNSTNTSSDPPPPLNANASCPGANPCAIALTNYTANQTPPLLYEWKVGSNISSTSEEQEEDEEE